MQGNEIHNFGKNVQSRPGTYARPQRQSELLELMGRHRDQSIRVIASGHAWSEGIVSEGLLVSLEKMTDVTVDIEASTVRVGAGCRIKHLLSQLRPHGLTLPSVGLIDEQSVAGATATGTHGSGKRCLSYYVRRVWIAHFDAETDQPTISEIDSGPELQAARCSLGLLGVVVELEFECRRGYEVEEHAIKHSSLANVLAAEKDYPMQQFYLMPWSWHWFAQHRQEVDAPKKSWMAGLYRIYWRLGIDWGLHLTVLSFAKILRSRFLVATFYRMILPMVFFQNWKVTDDSHAMLTMEHELFRHIEIELFVKRSDLPDAMEHVKQTVVAFGDRRADCQSLDNFPAESAGRYHHHYPICVRRVLVDDTLISMTSPRFANDVEDWYAISLICYEWPKKRDGFFAFASYLASTMKMKFDARCHWGKYFPHASSDVKHLYPRLDTFREVVQRFDPHGRFANEWLRRVILDRPTDPND